MYGKAAIRKLWLLELYQNKTSFVLSDSELSSDLYNYNDSNTLLYGFRAYILFIPVYKFKTMVETQLMRFRLEVM